MRDVEHLAQDFLRWIFCHKDGILFYNKHCFSDGEERTACFSAGRYRQVRIPSVRNPFQAHRLVWFLEFGKWPKKYIDHIDGDGHNNKIENLREASPAQNARNTTSRKNSSSKFLGVSFDTGRSKWKATIQIDGKTKYLGRFTNEMDAAVAYENAAMKHFGEFAKKIGRERSA